MIDQPQRDVRVDEHRGLKPEDGTSAIAAKSIAVDDADVARRGPPRQDGRDHEVAGRQVQGKNKVVFLYTQFGRYAIGRYGHQ